MPRLTHARWYGIVLAAIAVLFFLLLRTGEIRSVIALQSENRPELLVYGVNNLGSLASPSFTLYDPSTGIHTALPAATEFWQFSYSPDGLYTYPAPDIGNIEVYALDTLRSAGFPVNISQNPSRDDYPLAWSPDGRYLAFASYQDRENGAIYVWDGERAINITLVIGGESASDYRVSWSPDGRYLAFQPYQDEKHGQIYLWDGENTINITPANAADHVSGYSWSDDGRLALTLDDGRLAFTQGDDISKSEIFLWDGESTVNLSQNPTGSDYGPAWSADGRLAFLSERDGEFIIFVWDGISVENGSPNSDTFAKIAPVHLTYESFPSWANNGLLTFGGFAPEDTHQQVYLWDGETAINISQNPSGHNAVGSWTADGRWAFGTFYSTDLIYVRDADNRTILTTEGQYTPVWSSNGDYLVFCRRNGGNWTLLIWDGQKITPIVEGYEIRARWQSSSGIFCSSG